MGTNGAGKVIAVLGAGGQTGRSVIAALRSRQAKVRALLHSEAHIGSFGEDVDHRITELADRQSLISALEGADALYYITPVFDERELEFARNVFAASEAIGIKRFVYHSVLHAATPEMPHHQRKADVERELRHTAFKWTVIQAAMYMQTPLGFLQLENGILAPGFNVERRFSPVDLGDLGEAIANVLTQQGHCYATYEFAGVERLSFKDMAALLSQVLNRTVVAQSVLPDDVKFSRTSRPLNPRQRQELQMMMAHYDKYGLLGNGNVLRMVLGREPTSFRKMAERFFEK